MSVWTQAVSTALIDFFWQGALVGAALWVTLAILRRWSANAMTWAYAYARRLRRDGVAADGEVRAVVAALAARLGVTRPIHVLVSSIANGPSVIGWLRPAILLPPASAMGLTRQQLEAVLAHELAHIRRHDYAVNIVQTVAETLFFYHPIVWWTSRQIRIEREMCCDDVAVRSCGDAVAYARALTALARQRLAPELSMAATGSLKYRVQRLLGAPPREFGPSGAPGAIVLAMAAAVVVINIDRLQAVVESPQADQPHFEVASIKVNKANDNIVFDRGVNGKFTALGHSLRMLIQSAYRVQELQVLGGPDWIDSVRFDIQATEPSAATPAGAPGPVAPGPGEPSRQQLMLRSLLEDRFHLAVYKETRDRPVYALIPSRSDGKLGPKLQRSTTDCAATRTCGTNVGPGYIRVTGVTMAQLATAFSRLSNAGSSLNRLVVDRSGLEGIYDAEVRFTPEFIPPGFAGPGPAPGGLPAIDANGPSIFTAVQEQLGLKLDAQRGPVEVLVIDRADLPTEN